METSRVNLTELGIVLATDKGHLIHAIDIPVDVSSDAWIPETDSYDVLRGDELQDGMVVRLINGLGSRFMLTTDVVQHRQFVEFDGVYSDGTVHKIRYGHSFAWAVLKEKNAILALTPEQAINSLVETMFKDIPVFVTDVAGGLFKTKNSATDIRPDDEQEKLDDWAEGIFNEFQHDRQKLNASSAEKHAEKIVGPQKKTVSALQVLDIIELFEASYVVMDILRTPSGKFTDFTLHLRDLETRKNTVNLEVSFKTEIKVLGSLV